VNDTHADIRNWFDYGEDASIKRWHSLKHSILANISMLVAHPFITEFLHPVISSLRNVSIFSWIKSTLLRKR